MPRPLVVEEINRLLAMAVPIHLATIDHEGVPHVTPLWFEWDGDAFWMTSLTTKPHVRRLRANPAASVCVDVESAERLDGERPNQQVRAVGQAELLDDIDGTRTRRITEKYLKGPSRDAVTLRRASQPRVAIRLRPASGLVAVASV